MNREEIINFAWKNDINYSTEFSWKNKTVLVFSVNSFLGLKLFGERVAFDKVIDSHNENYLIGVIV